VTQVLPYQQRRIPVVKFQFIISERKIVRIRPQRTDKPRRLRFGLSPETIGSGYFYASIFIEHEEQEVVGEKRFKHREVVATIEGHRDPALVKRRARIITDALNAAKE
jgi:hypothetical protein